MKRFLSIFRKSLLEQMRSPWELALIMLTAPAFVIVYWLFFGGGSTAYTLLVLDLDGGPHAGRVVEAVAGLAYSNGQPVLKIKTAGSLPEAQSRLRDRDAAALVVIPAGFSSRIDAVAAGRPAGQGDPLVFSGDLTNPTYTVAAVLANGVIDEYLRAETGQPHPIGFLEEPLGGSAARSEFETYVPGLLVISIVMMIFSAAMRVTSEVERGGLRRLALTRLSPLEFLAGISAVQLLVGLAATLLTFAAAAALGFRSQGPLGLAIFIGGLTAFSVIGMGLVVASYSRTSVEALLLANLPLVLMMFFSGGVFPIQRIPLFSLGERNFALFDILPQTHAVLALNKVLTLGAGPGEVIYEVAMVLALSVIYFAFGVWIFGRRVMRH